MDRLCFFERFVFPSVHRRSQINEILYKTALDFLDSGGEFKLFCVALFSR